MIMSLMMMDSLQELAKHDTEELLIGGYWNVACLVRLRESPKYGDQLSTSVESSTSVALERSNQHSE